MAYKKIINIAVIAHVDAGKSTLVDAFLNQSQVLDKNQVLINQIMDNNDLERERGITIYSKNCSINYQDIKINIVDTPGHADFSSEVERIIKTVDTVILLVDSSEGPMPQTRFVLKKSLEQGLNPILLINKIDKPDARIAEVIDLVYELFVDLEANDQQLEFPILYGIARDGIVKYNLDDNGVDLEPLFQTIIKHTSIYPDLSQQHLKLQISSLEYDDYVGRIGVGRLLSGTLKKGQSVMVANNEGKYKNCSISNLYVMDGLKRVSVSEASSGDIVMISGIDDILIGDTINQPDYIDICPAIKIDPPTITMNFLVNTSPFAGNSGKYVTSRNIKARLDKELESNVGLTVETTDSTDTFIVSGRGELHLSILVEKMRREGYELAISKPEVIFRRDENNHLLEPYETVIIDVNEEYSGSVISALSLKKGEMLNMEQINSRIHMEWLVPTRGLIGYRQDFINMTRGDGIMVRQFAEYKKYAGEILQKVNGSLVSMANGIAMTYSLWNLEDRGIFFIGPQTPVYEGMVIGLANKDQDMEVNPTKNKKATSIRSAGNDEAMRLTPARLLSLEEAIGLIKDDELVEVTPDAIRIRKKYLSAIERKRANRKEEVIIND